jgi:hypothetical protein
LYEHGQGNKIIPLKLKGIDKTACETRGKFGRKGAEIIKV